MAEKKKEPKESNEYALSWEEFDKLCYELAEKITNDRITFNNIICVARGGLVIGRIMCDILDLPLHVVYTQRYKKGTKETYSIIKLTEVLGTSMLGGNILVVDDITDEGITMKTVVAKIKKMVDINIVKSAVLLHKPRSIFVPDYYTRTTDKWIIFPYEVNEYSKLRALESKAKPSRVKAVGPALKPV